MNNASRFQMHVIGVLALAGSVAPASAALVVNAPMQITEIVTVQPVILSDNGGGNTAEFFGTPGQQSNIEGFVDTIWAQAGIDVNFLAPSSWNSTFSNWGSNGPPTNGGATRPISDLNTIVDDAASAGVSHADPNVINMFFVSISAGFPLLSDNSAAGLAFRPGNGISQYVGVNLLVFSGGQEVIASVVAHEIGHNLGLPHIVEAENLMQTSGLLNQGEKLNSAQITAALASNLSVSAVPLPAAIWLFGSGLIVLIGIARTQKV